MTLTHDLFYADVRQPSNDGVHTFEDKSEEDVLSWTLSMKTTKADLKVE
jgi:hypothetical protein